MVNADTVSHMLQQALLRKKRQNPKFSLRQMAKKLEVSPSFLSQIVNGRRGVPLQFVPALCSVLDLDHEKRDYILGLLLQKKGIQGRPPLMDEGPVDPETEELWEQVPSNHFSLLKEWFYLPILNCTLLRDYDGTTEFIAKRLGLAVPLVEGAMETLTEADLLEVRDGRRVKSSNFNEYQSIKRVEEVRRFHSACLDKAKSTLAQRTSDEDMERRLMKTLVITGSRQEMAWAKQRLAQVIKEIGARMGSAPEEDVYQLSIQLFPLTHKD